MSNAVRDRQARSKGLRSERGAGIVEFAMILPVFMCLVLGTLTFANAYFERISMEDAVRDGARFGATMHPFNKQTVKERISGLSAGELSVADICVELVTVDVSTPDTSCGVDDPEGSDGDDVVKVSAEKETHIEAFFFARDMTLTAKAAATYER